MASNPNTSGIDEVVHTWKAYIDTINDWQELVQGVEPKSVGCGLVYELPNPSGINRPGEDFCIADMRQLSREPGYSEPHYHPKGVTELYFVLGGFALSVVGGAERHVGPGDIIVTPENTTHYVIPDQDFVIAVVNQPPFTPDCYIPITETDPSVGFDKEQFERLTGQSI